MVQRIQSVFLMLTDIVLVALFFVPFASVAEPGEKFSRSLTLTDNYIALGGQIALCIIASLGVVKFRNRPLQMKICIVGALLSLVYTGYLAALPSIQPNTTSEIGTWISMANFALFLLAWRFVKKDEEMVRSSDRLR